MSDFLDLHDDPSARRLLLAVAVTMIMVPFIQAGAQIWPLQLTNIQWRFSAANALVSALMSPFLGMALLLVIARATDSRGLARTVGVLGAVFSVGLLASLALFVLDAQQLKTIVSTQMTQAFTNTTFRTGASALFFAVAFPLMAIAGFSTPRRSGLGAGKLPSGKDAGDSVGLIVGQ